MRLRIAPLLMLAAAACASGASGRVATVSWKPGARLEPARVAVLPFQNHNREGFNVSVADQFAGELLAMGFEVVDRGAALRAFERLGIPLDRPLADRQIRAAAESLEARYLVFGDVTWSRSPSGGYRYIESETVRFVDPAGAEVVLTATCCDLEDAPRMAGKSVIAEIGAAVRRGVAGAPR